MLSGLPPVDLVAVELANRWKTKEAIDNPTIVERLTGLQNVNLESRTAHTHHPAEAPSIHINFGDETTLSNRIYTDASKTTNGTGAAYVVYANNRELDHRKIRQHRNCSALQAELAAIREALRFIKEHAYAYRECSIVTDSKPALRAINDIQQTEMTAAIRRLLVEIRATTEVRWHWVKSHSENAGNDRADALAREAINDDNTPIVYDRTPFAAVKKALREKTESAWQRSKEGTKTGK